MTREEVAQLRAGATSILIGAALVALAVTGHASLQFGVAAIAALAVTARKT